MYSFNDIFKLIFFISLECWFSLELFIYDLSIDTMSELLKLMQNTQKLVWQATPGMTGKVQGPAPLQLTIVYNSISKESGNFFWPPWDTIYMWCTHIVQAKHSQTWNKNQ